MNLKEGMLLVGGKYRITRFIGSGGFGCTYEAEHVMLRKRVAIKEFFVRDFCNRDERTAHVTVGTESKRELVDKLRRKFLDEARAVANLQHRGIVGVSDVFEENGTAYYVMDFIDGESLSDILSVRGPLPEATAVRYIRQVAEALAFVHAHNRLHLDVKPGNIMINSHDEAILIDFGTSKQYDEANGENTSTLMGKTPGYAPPEQMGNDIVTFTPATDIYALGATLYKMVSGITPLSATLLISGSKLAPLPKDTSQAMRKAIDTSMQMNKYQRPHTIADFLALLDGPAPAKPSEPDGVTVIDGSVQPPTLPGRPGSSRNKWIIVVAVAVACIFVGVAVYRCAESGSSSKETPVEATEETVDTIDIDHIADTIDYVYMDMESFIYAGPLNSDDQPEGEGKGIYDTGTYEGEYSAGCRQGKGSFVTADGTNRFEGTFKDDRYDEGTLTYIADGSHFKGNFRNGEPYTGTWYNSDGSLYCRLVNGNVQ